MAFVAESPHYILSSYNFCTGGVRAGGVLLASTYGGFEKGVLPGGVRAGGVLLASTYGGFEKGVLPGGVRAGGVLRGGLSPGQTLFNAMKCAFTGINQRDGQELIIYRKAASRCPKISSCSHKCPQATSQDNTSINAKIH